MLQASINWATPLRLRTLFVKDKGKGQTERIFDVFGVVIFEGKNWETVTYIWIYEYKLDAFLKTMKITPIYMFIK